MVYMTWPLTWLANGSINGWICQTGQFSLVFKTRAYNDSLLGVIVRNIEYLKFWPQILICSFSPVFQARGLKKHLKRLNAPKHWMLDKLGGAFVCTVLTIVDDIILLKFICNFHLNSCTHLAWLCRHPSHHLDPTSPGSVFLWSSSYETG